jgi:hypothetical protein
VLQALGVKLDLNAEQVRTCLAETSIAFMFAPVFHPAMKAIVPVRKALGVRTVFNILGPLLNPADAGRLLIGVYSLHLVELVARSLFELNVERAMVIHCGGLDELAPIAVADVAHVTREGVTFGKLDPFELGFAKCSVEDLKGGDADENAAMLRKVLAGETPGPLEVRRAPRLALRVRLVEFALHGGQLGGERGIARVPAAELLAQRAKRRRHEEGLPQPQERAEHRDEGRLRGRQHVRGLERAERAAVVALRIEREAASGQRVVDLEAQLLKFAVVAHALPMRRRTPPKSRPLAFEFRPNLSILIVFSLILCLV